VPVGYETLISPPPVTPLYQIMDERYSVYLRLNEKAV
jgi:hypothetical protein